MNIEPRYDMSLLSWNILAPCWVNKEWYPLLYEPAADDQTRLNTIAARIASLGHDVVMIQEAQENKLSLFKEKLDEAYFFEYFSNDSTTASAANGLLTLIRKNWKYASEAKITNGILDPGNGDAMQILTIPSKNIHLVNLHLYHAHRTAQAKMVQDKCNELLGGKHSMTILAGDLNVEPEEYHEFGWLGYEEAFQKSIEDAKIPTYYADPESCERNMVIDHIFYTPNQVQLIQQGKAWDTPDRSLEESLKQFGSDHIYIWAIFDFI
jgi:endonuclease/exonuclease/phosphatase family metal-dependent hydrolase